MKNNSLVYGGYGGVTKQNHYVPPPAAPFIPQPKTVPFYESQANLVNSLLSSIQQTKEFYEQNHGDIMYREFVGIADNQEFYQITTENDLNDIIVYRTPAASAIDTFEVGLLDGGFF